MDHKDVIIQDLRAENKILEELEQLKKQPAAVDMDKLTTEMMEHICDNLCKYPNRVDISQEELEDICAECKMGKFVCDILNTYNHLQRASYDVDKVLEQIKELRRYCDNIDCKKCKYKDTCFDKELEKIVKAGRIIGCVDNQPLPQPYKKDHLGEVNGMVTNADRIRNMTDEELAEFIKCARCDAMYGSTCEQQPYCEGMMGKTCNAVERIDKGLLQWLQAEVKEGKE